MSASSTEPAISARDLTRRKVFGFLDFNLTGSALMEAGVRLPTTSPETAYVLRVRALDVTDLARRLQRVAE